MRKTYGRMLLITLIVMGLAAPVFSQSPEDEARKYFVRGQAAAEMAKSEAGLANAVAEFKKAIEIAPNIAAIWYNLALVQAKTGQIKDAIGSYRKYLALAPQAEDAGKIRDEIIKLEYRMEQSEKMKSYSGTWIGEDGQPYKMSVLDGNRMILETRDYQIPVTELHSNYPQNRGPLKRNIKLKYSFELQGNRITGTWHRDKFNDYLCQIPEDGGELTGELRESVYPRSLTLRYTFTQYWAVMKLFLIGDEYCREVDAGEKKQAEKKFRSYRKVNNLNAKSKVPRAWIGILFQDITPLMAENMKLKDQRGALVNKVFPGSPAEKGGIKETDIVMAIDGKPIKDGRELLAVVASLPIGKKVETIVLRDGQEKKLDIILEERKDLR